MGGDNWCWGAAEASLASLDSAGGPGRSPSLGGLESVGNGEDCIDCRPGATSWAWLLFHTGTHAHRHAHRLAAVQVCGSAGLQGLGRRSHRLGKQEGATASAGASHGVLWSPHALRHRRRMMGCRTGALASCRCASCEDGLRGGV